MQHIKLSDMILKTQVYDKLLLGYCYDNSRKQHAINTPVIVEEQ